MNSNLMAYHWTEKWNIYIFGPEQKGDNIALGFWTYLAIVLVINRNNLWYLILKFQQVMSSESTTVVLMLNWRVFCGMNVENPKFVLL